MVRYTLPEMKAFKQRMVANMIHDVKQQRKDDMKKWNLTLQAVQNFDAQMTVDNFDILALCKGSRSPLHIGERIKFSLLAEDYLRKQLQIVLVDDMPIHEQADLHHEIWKKAQEMAKMDWPKLADLRNKFFAITNFIKHGDNHYTVRLKIQ